jgi:hypothetical protein
MPIHTTVRGDFGKMENMTKCFSSAGAVTVEVLDLSDQHANGCAQEGRLIKKEAGGGRVQESDRTKDDESTRNLILAMASFSRR